MEENTDDVSTGLPDLTIHEGSLRVQRIQVRSAGLKKQRPYITSRVAIRAGAAITWHWAVSMSSFVTQVLPVIVV